MKRQPEGISGALPDLGELRRLAEAATPGPWIVESSPDELHLEFTLESDALGPRNWFGDAKRFISGTSYNNGDDRDAMTNVLYIAAAHPQAVLALLHRLTELEAAVDALAEAVANRHARRDAMMQPIPLDGSFKGFPPDSDEILAAALAAYRAVRSKEQPSPPTRR